MECELRSRGSRKREDRHINGAQAGATAPDGRTLERLSESIVTFNRVTAQQADTYIASEEWRGKAGGYAINGLAASFVRFLSGSYSGVVGLPLFETAQLLRGCGWPVP